MSDFSWKRGVPCNVDLMTRTVLSGGCGPAPKPDTIVGPRASKADYWDEDEWHLVLPDLKRKTASLVVLYEWVVRYGEGSTTIEWWPGNPAEDDGAYGFEGITAASATGNAREVSVPE